MPQVFPGSTVQDAGVVAHKQPVQTADGANAAARQDKYGAFSPWHVAPTRHQFSEEGSYLVATNPTVSTGLTWVAAQTAFSNTAPNFYISNPDSARSIYLDYLKLIATAVGTATASIQYAVHVDVVGRTFTTDNMLVIVPVNPNGNASNLLTPIIKAQNSASVSAMAVPSSTNRLVGRGQLGGLCLAGTEMLLTFGSTDAGCYVGAADAAGQPGRRGASSGPVIIPPGGSCTIYIWAPSSSGSIAPEFEMGMWCR